MNTFEKVACMLAEKCNVAKEKITPESEIVKDLGADSLDVVEMLMDLESEFGIEIDEESANGLKTVQDVVNIIDKK